MLYISYWKPETEHLVKIRRLRIRREKDIPLVSFGASVKSRHISVHFRIPMLRYSHTDNVIGHWLSMKSLHNICVLFKTPLGSSWNHVNLTGKGILCILIDLDMYPKIIMFWWLLLILLSLVITTNNSSLLSMFYGGCAQCSYKQTRGGWAFLPIKPHLMGTIGLILIAEVRI